MSFLSIYEYMVFYQTLLLVSSADAVTMHEQTVELTLEEDPTEQTDDLKNELRQLFYLYFQNCNPEEQQRIQQNMNTLTKTR